MRNEPDAELAAAVTPAHLAASSSVRAGSLPTLRTAVGRAAIVAVAAVGFGLLAQWPLLEDRPWLVASNLVVAGGFAAGAVLVSDERRHAPTRRTLLVASFLWSAAWLQGWHAGPWQFIASLIGPAPEAVAIWGLLQFPRPWRSRMHARSVTALLIAVQLASAAATFTNQPHWWWPTINNQRLHAVAASVYYNGGVACTVLLVGVYLVRVRKLRGHELRVTLPLAAAVVAAGAASSSTDIVAGSGATGPLLWTLYAWEGVLLAAVPLSFAVSYLLRRLSIEELAGRVDPYASATEIRAEFRRALRDPEVEIWTPFGNGWIDAEGTPRDQFDTSNGRQYVIVIDPEADADDGDGTLAIITYAADLSRFADLVAAAGTALRLTLRTNQLRRELEIAIRDVEESRQRVAVVIAQERQQVGRRADLGPVTHLTAARETIGRLLLSGDEALDGDTGRRLGQAAELLQHSSYEIGRISTGGSPAGLENGLARAVPLALRYLPLTMELTPVRADAPAELAAFLVITEAVANALKYASGSAIHVAVGATDNMADMSEEFVHNHAERWLVVAVTDHGPGGADTRGHGLISLSNRLAALGGHLQVNSPPGGPTTLRALIPRYA